jgi:YegS/Rv2252/BmrU family lipid kinase
MGRFTSVHVVSNPAAGADQPVLSRLNAAFAPAGLDWDVSITHRAGDAAAQARAAAESGVDVVAVYGGDGTVMEVANGLLGAQRPGGDVPLAILPGGTGNAFAVDLGIPLDLSQAAALITADSPALRRFDLGRVTPRQADTERHFLLRASIGLQAELADKATREMKDRFGVLAYLLAGIELLAQPQRSKFSLTVDGKSIESEGVTCLVANSASLGRVKLNLAATAAPDDGLLDVFILNDDPASAVSVAASLLDWEQIAAALPHWQGKHIQIEADPARPVTVDGEPYGETPLKVDIVPGALHVIVPG